MSGDWSGAHRRPLARLVDGGGRLYTRFTSIVGTDDLRVAMFSVSGRADMVSRRP